MQAISDKVTAITVEAFEQFVNLPENADRNFELIGGEIVEVPSNVYSSKIAMIIGAKLFAYIDSKGLGHITGEAGGYMVSGDCYAPDVAYISKTRQPEFPREGFNPIPPDLAVEVVSPSDSARQLSIKITNYLAAGTVVWVVYPKSQEVVIHAPGKAAKILDKDGILDGGDLLPGFTLPIKDIFPQ